MPQTKKEKKLNQFLKSQKSTKKKKQKNNKVERPDINFEYDDEVDVLYAFVGENSTPAESIEFDHGVVVRVDPDTKQYVGFTIVNYMDRKKKGQLRKIPHFKQVELPSY